MRATMSIVWREIQDRRAVPVAALFAGLLPFLAPLIPGLGANDPAAVRQGMALNIAFGFSLFVALMAGVSSVGRDFGEGRMGFDLARPMSAWAIGAGRGLGAVGLGLITALICLLPMTIIGGGLFQLELVNPWGWAGVLGYVFWLFASVMTLVPLAHLASVALRSRSRWLILDLAALGVALALTLSAVHRIGGTGALATLTVVEACLAGVAFVALWVAMAVQIVAGRSDLIRGHRLQSLALAPLLLLAGLGGVAFASWLVAVEPRDLLRAEKSLVAPRGDWAILGGPVADRPGDYEPAFLVNARTGASTSIAFPWSATFSADGRHAAWAQDAGSEGRAEVVVADLTAAPVRPVATSIVVHDQLLFGLVLSSNGSRIALLEGDTLSVLDVASGRVLGVARLSNPPLLGQKGGIDFRTDDVVRVYSGTTELRIEELELSQRKWSVVGAVSGEPLAWTRTPDHDRILVCTKGIEARLVDGLTLRTIASIDARCGRLLHDGRIVARSRTGSDDETSSRHEGSMIRVFSRDGVEQGAFATDRWLHLAAEVAPGVLLAEIDGQSIARVDVERGIVRPLGQGHVLGTLYGSGMPEIGSTGSRLVWTKSGLALFDPTNDAFEPLLR
jgi:hypothetical protein